MCECTCERKRTKRKKEERKREEKKEKVVADTYACKLGNLSLMKVRLPASQRFILPT